MTITDGPSPLFFDLEIWGCVGAANEATAVRNGGSPPGPSCPGAELGSEPMSLPDTGTESSICFPNPLGPRFPQIAGTLKQSHRVKGQAGEPQPLPSSPAPAPVSLSRALYRSLSVLLATLSAPGRSFPPFPGSSTAAAAAFPSRAH